MASSVGATSPIHQRAEEAKREMRAASDEALRTPLVKPQKLSHEQYQRIKQRMNSMGGHKRFYFIGGKWSPPSTGKKEEKPRSTDEKEEKSRRQPLTPDGIKDLLNKPDPDIDAKDEAGGANLNGTMVIGSYQQMDVYSQSGESPPPTRCARIAALFRKFFCRC
jgi:hypothetical protein